MVLITSSISTSVLALGLALEWGASGFVPDTGFLAGLERVVDHLGNCLVAISGAISILWLAVITLAVFFKDTLIEKRMKKY